MAYESCSQQGIITKGIRKFDDGRFDFGTVWTKNGEFRFTSQPMVKSTGVKCELGQWVLVKTNSRWGRVDHISKLNEKEVQGKIDEDGDFVVPHPIWLKQYIVSEVPGIRFYRNEFFQFIKMDQEFYATNENQQIVVYLKKLPESISILGQKHMNCYWVAKEFYTLRPEDLNPEKPKQPMGFMPDPHVPNLEEKFAHFRVNGSNGLPENWRLDRKKKKKTPKPPRRNPFAPVEIFWHPSTPATSNSRAPSTSDRQDDYGGDLTPPATPSLQDTRNIRQSGDRSSVPREFLDLPTSKAMVTTKTPTHLIIFLFKIKKPAILNLESYSESRGSVPDLNDEFTCRYRKIDEVMGLEFEVVGLTSYNKCSLDIKTEGMENHLLLPINLFFQEERFHKFNVVNSNGICDYIVIGKEVKDQNTELMPTSALLRKYKGDIQAREMIGACSLKIMNVPKMMVDSSCGEGEGNTLAWVWKLERVVSYLEEFPGYQNPRDTVSG